MIAKKKQKNFQRFPEQSQSSKESSAVIENLIKELMQIEQAPMPEDRK